MDKQNIEAFWNWFEQNKDEEPMALISSVNERLKLVSFGLSAELSVQSSPKELIVTPQGVKKFFSDAYALVMLHLVLKVGALLQQNSQIIRVMNLKWAV